MLYQRELANSSDGQNALALETVGIVSKLIATVLAIFFFKVIAWIWLSYFIHTYEIFIVSNG